MKMECKEDSPVKEKREPLFRVCLLSFLRDHFLILSSSFSCEKGLVLYPSNIVPLGCVSNLIILSSNKISFKIFLFFVNCWQEIIQVHAKRNVVDGGHVSSNYNFDCKFKSCRTKRGSEWPLMIN